MRYYCQFRQVQHVLTNFPGHLMYANLDSDHRICSPGGVTNQPSRNVKEPEGNRVELTNLNLPGRWGNIDLPGRWGHLQVYGVPQTCQVGGETQTCQVGGDTYRYIRYPRPARYVGETQTLQVGGDTYKYMGKPRLDR